MHRAIVPHTPSSLAPDLSRRRLLQVPTAFSIAHEEVTDLIEAGGSVLRHSPEFRALVQSLLRGAPQPSAAPAASPQ